MYFPDRGCVRPLRHLYDCATGGHYVQNPACRLTADVTSRPSRATVSPNINPAHIVAPELRQFRGVAISVQSNFADGSIAAANALVHRGR